MSSLDEWREKRKKQIERQRQLFSVIAIWINLLLVGALGASLGVFVCSMFIGQVKVSLIGSLFISIPWAILSSVFFMMLALGIFAKNVFIPVVASTVQEGMNVNPWRFPAILGAVGGLYVAATKTADQHSNPQFAVGAAVAGEVLLLIVGWGFWVVFRSLRRSVG